MNNRQALELAKTAHSNPIERGVTAALKNLSGLPLNKEALGIIASHVETALELDDEWGRENYIDATAFLIGSHLKLRFFSSHPHVVYAMFVDPLGKVFLVDPETYTYGYQRTFAVPQIKIGETDV